MQLHIVSFLWHTQQLVVYPSMSHTHTHTHTHTHHSPKGDFLYKVVDHASRALVDVESIETLSGMTFPKPSFGDQEDPVTEAMWAVSVAADKHAFLVIILDNVNHQTGRYLFLASNE